MAGVSLTWWGLDCAVSHVALGWWGPEGKGAASERLTGKPRDAERLFLLGELTRRLVRDLLAEPNGPALPSAVLVERPTGRFPNPALQQACGVIQAAVYAELLHELWATPVFLVPVASWKRAAVGSGRASKAEVMRWAAGHAEVLTEDEADALAIACAGHALYGAKVREVRPIGGEG